MQATKPRRAWIGKVTASLLLGWGSGLLLSCSAPIAIQPPENAAMTTAPVDVRRGGAVVVALPTFDAADSTIVGHHYGGLVPTKSHDYTIASLTEQGILADFRAAARTELKRWGYTVIELEDRIGNAPVLVPTVVAIEANSKSTIGSPKSVASICVEWTAREYRTLQEIITRTTCGYMESETSVTAALANAFRNSLSQFVADTTLPRVSGDATPGWTIAEIPRFPADRSASDILESARGAVVTLETAAGTGSGFFISREGLVLTNAHVVGSDQRVTAIFADSTRIEGFAVRADTLIDAALIKLSEAGHAAPADGYPALRIAYPPLIRIGEDVFAIGSPLGSALAQSVTKGIMSGMRDVEGRTLLQTDVAISPGNSGGPLINGRGEVVGIVVAKVWALGLVEGVGFAIPIEDALDALDITIAENARPDMGPK
jgi:S1-C subfamily serine protease